MKTIRNTAILIAVVTLFLTTVYEANSLSVILRKYKYGKREQLWAPQEHRLSRRFRLKEKINQVMAY